MQPTDRARLELPAAAVVRFIGDLHLGSAARNDAFGDRDELLADFLADCGVACDVVVFMGDTFDLPQAFSCRRVLRGHPKAAAAIGALCRRIPVYFVRGNHDWGVDYPAIFDGARACERLAIAGMLVMHGHQLDRYCRPERRGHRAAVTAHHLAERLFRFRFRVPLSAHDSWQNRVAHRLGARYGRNLRRLSTVYRWLGLHRKAAECEAFIHYWSRSVWGDSHALFLPVCDALCRGEQDAIVLGHTHSPGVVGLGGGTYVNAGSWAFGSAQYAEWNGARFEVRDAVSGQRFGDEAYRWMVEGPDPGDFFSWWERHSPSAARGAS